MSSDRFLGAVIVTHNHGATIGATLESLAKQDMPADRVIVVDSGSDDTSWTHAWAARPTFETILLDRNVGFTGGNNEGWRRLNRRDGLILFLNPDVVMPRDQLRRLRTFMSEERVRQFGAVSPRLIGWDFGSDVATGLMDSSGIFPHWSGGWRDRREGSPPSGDWIEEVPALCGAYLLCRAEALHAVSLPDRTVWDESYFTYKEDIELCLRLRRAGYRLGVWHGSWAGHGRGWKRRSEVSMRSRLMSARNEIRMHATYRPLRLPYSVAKWLYVRFLER